MRGRGDGQVVHHVHFVMVLVVACDDLHGRMCVMQNVITKSAVGVVHAMIVKCSHEIGKQGL